MASVGENIAATALSDLISRLESAEEGSPELDARIYCAVNGLTFVSAGRDGSIHFEPDEHGTHTMVTPHPYTSSLDRALELVPEGYGWAVSGGTGHFANKRLFHCAEVGRFECQRAPSAPIALCIAALKASAALKARA